MRLSPEANRRAKALWADIRSNEPRRIVRFDPKLFRTRAEKLLSEPLIHAQASRPIVPDVPLIQRTQAQLLMRWVLPLHCCPLENQMLEQAPWRRKAVKKACYGYMFAELRLWPPSCSLSPMFEHVTIRCLRWSSKAPDSHANWAKYAIDRLLPMKKAGDIRLNFIRDDGPEHCELYYGWDWAPPKCGFGVVELYV